MAQGFSDFSVFTGLVIQFSLDYRLIKFEVSGDIDFSVTSDEINEEINNNKGFPGFKISISKKLQNDKKSKVNEADFHFISFLIFYLFLL